MLKIKTQLTLQGGKTEIVFYGGEMTEIIIPASITVKIPRGVLRKWVAEADAQVREMRETRKKWAKKNAEARAIEDQKATAKKGSPFAHAPIATSADGQPAVTVNIGSIAKAARK